MSSSETYYRPVFYDKEFDRTFSSDYLYLEPKTEDDRFHDYKLMGWLEESVIKNPTSSEDGSE
jgi:hypothetical protein